MALKRTFLTFIFTLKLINSLDSCVHECFDAKSCTNTSINCNKCSQICSIKCIGNGSCSNLHIVQNPSPTIMTNLNCEGDKSCNNITFTTSNYMSSNSNDLSSNMVSFICECIPLVMYEIYKYTIMDMFDFVRNENFWVYHLKDLLFTALNIADTAQLIRYHIDYSNDKHSFYINNDDNKSDVCMDYIIYTLLNYNQECEAIDDYILSHLQDIPDNMDIVCYLNGEMYELLYIIDDSDCVFIIKAAVSDGDLVVLKFFDMQHSKCDAQLLEQEVEAQKISNVALGDKSVHIIDHSSLVEMNSDGYRFVIVMEYVSDGDLSTYIKHILDTTQPASNEEEFANFMICRLLDDMLWSLTRLYQYKHLNYLHNDIKPGNIFLNFNEMLFKLADYGHMMQLSFLLNVSNGVDSLGTPNYIGLSMSDLMMHLYANDTVYNDAKNMYLTYPNHADLYQLLSSALSLYNTLCDPQYVYLGDMESVCGDLDVNPEDKESSFRQYLETDQSNYGLAYGANKERHQRLKEIKYENIENNKLFGLIARNLIGLNDDYLHAQLGNNNNTYSLAKFSADLQGVCDNDYIININEDGNNKEKGMDMNRFNYQMWIYDETKKSSSLHKIMDDIAQFESGDDAVCISVNDTIIYKRSSNEIVFPNKENVTHIHRLLHQYAFHFNRQYY